MKFYSVTHFQYSEYTRHYGYFQNINNAMNAALIAVANIQDEIVLMRDHCISENVPYDNYKEDMKRIDDVSHVNNVAEWKGNYNAVTIFQEETED